MSLRIMVFTLLLASELTYLLPGLENGSGYPVLEPVMELYNRFFGTGSYVKSLLLTPADKLSNDIQNQ